jgi:hypothetical protein
MSKDKVMQWFKKRREFGDDNWYSMSTVVKMMGCKEQTGGSTSIRRSIRSLKDDGVLDEQRVDFWKRYFRINDKYLNNFTKMLK